MQQNVGTPALRLTSVTKSYGETVALDDANLTARQGKVTGILGRNGAGKSTMISLIVGANKMDGGRIEVFGANPPYAADVRRRLCLAPQRLALYEKLSVTENLALLGALYGLRGANLRQRIDHVAREMDLTSFLARQVQDCSEGMKRRANMAAAMLPDADLVLLDEPTAGVDVQSREKILDTVASLKELGKCVIYTTHYIEEVEVICDEALVLHKGRVLACAPPGELVRAHGGSSVISHHDRVSGEAVEHVTDRPFEYLQALLNRRAEIGDLKISPPKLSDAFVALIEEDEG